MMTLLFILNASNFSYHTLNISPNTQMIYQENERRSFLFYFVLAYSDGLASDFNNDLVTDQMFKRLADGTSKYSKEEIQNLFQEYHLTLTPRITAEKSYLLLKGRRRYIKESFELFCNLLTDATFPDEKRLTINEQNKTLHQKQVDYLLNNSLDAKIALNLKLFTPLPQIATFYPHVPEFYEFKADSSTLKEKLDYFQTQVAKTLYIATSSESLEQVILILKDNCKLKSGFNFYKRPIIQDVEKTVSNSNHSKVYFVKSNKSDTDLLVTIGRFIPNSLTKSNDFSKIAQFLMGKLYYTPTGLKMYPKSLLGNLKTNWTDVLLTPSFNQNSFGRTAISLYSKDDSKHTVGLKLIDDLNQAIANLAFTDEDLNESKNFIEIERARSENMPGDQLLQYILDKKEEILITPTAITDYLKEILDPDKQTILFMGSEEYLPKLQERYGDIIILDVQKTLETI